MNFWHYKSRSLDVGGNLDEVSTSQLKFVESTLGLNEAKILQDSGVTQV